MKTYALWRDLSGNGHACFYEREQSGPLLDGRDLWDFGGEYYNWSAHTRGTDQLAFALLLSATLCPAIAFRYWEQMAEEALSRLPHEGGILDDMDILRWIVLAHADTVQVTAAYRLNLMGEGGCHAN